MRFWLVLALALAACGHRESSDPDKHTPIEPIAGGDEHCDPSKTRVCVGTDVVECNAGTLGRRLKACREGCEGGTCANECSDDGTKLIYLVDLANDFMSFDPRKISGNPFHVIGKLHCPSSSSPFSMSVDRKGVAWVLYNDGQLFKVSIQDARCERTNYVPDAGLSLFGMGFSTDKAGGTTEKLYAAANDGTHELASLDTAKGNFTPHNIGRIDASDDRNPELTGTSEGKLFGFWPTQFGPAFVQEIDPKSGATRGTRWNLGKSSIGDVEAWAFAQWGGVFYVFVTTFDGSGQNSTVRTIDRKTGAYSVAIDHLPYVVTGAGVSTCAPERDDARSAALGGG